LAGARVHGRRGGEVAVVTQHQTEVVQGLCREGMGGTDMGFGQSVDALE